MGVEHERAGVPHGGPPRGPDRRRTAAAAAGRTLLTVTLLVVVYYRAPLDLRLDAGVLVWLAAGLVALAVAVGWQVRAVMASDTPRLRATEAAAVGLPFLLLLYASVYAVVSLGDPASFTQRLGRTDALYYAMTVFTTVGFGDIAPATQAARILTMTQMVVGILAVGVVAKLLFGVAQVAAGRRERATGQDGGLHPLHREQEHDQHHRQGDSEQDHGDLRPGDDGRSPAPPTVSDSAGFGLTPGGWDAGRPPPTVDP